MDSLNEKVKSFQKYPVYYAAFSKHKENVEKSSSGGVFHELCRMITTGGGIVYGAVQKNVMEVAHERADTLEDTEKFRRSKYLRSRVGTCYENVRRDLEENKQVLFSGTPCQIEGLYRFLGNKTENLYTVEVVCHGIPLKDAYGKYVQEKEAVHGAKMCEINFRDKRYGWNENSICEIYENGREEVIQSTVHLHHSLYLKGINVEAECGDCRYAKIPRTANITLADFWKYKGMLLEKSGNRGLSLISVNDSKGEKLLAWAWDNLYAEKVEQEEALSSCRHMNHAPFVHFNQAAFRKLIRRTTFHRAAALCTEFGDVVDAETLCMIETEDINKVFKIFIEDSQEIIYLCRTQKHIEGIVTFGAFIKACINDKRWINDNFQQVCLYEKNCIDKIRHIFAENDKINRIPIMDDKGRLLFEVRRTAGANGREDPRRYLLPFVKMTIENRKLFFYKRPDFLQDFAYSERQQMRIEGHHSFPVLCRNMDENADELREILKERYSKKYVKKLCDIPPIIRECGYYRHKDSCSELINVIGGLRRTCYQPEKFDFTIHIYGRCGVFGYAVEDAETMPSRLQKMVSKDEIRVVSHSTWGAEDVCIIGNLMEDLLHGVIEQQDMVILYMDYFPCMKELLDMGIYVRDTTYAFHASLGHHNIDFYDIPGHMNAEGYDFIAEYIYKDIKNDLQVWKTQAKRYMEKGSKKESGFMEPMQVEDLVRYTEKINKEISNCNLQEVNVGAVVVNCNPFTKGHRYLMETAASKVDVLLVFVVEEDKSEFPFSDRFEMVKLGTEDLKNVYVFPSGKHIVSIYTWPEYFFREKKKAVVVDASEDLGIFARYIAPALNIKTRFIGTEPLDKVTAVYNQSQKELLPRYGIKVVEIERLKNEEGYISAKKVRQSIKEGKSIYLDELLPQSTLDYLKEKKYIDISGEKNVDLF